MTDKYHKKITCQGSKPCIYLCNPDMDPTQTTTLAFRDWLDKNTKIVYLYSQIF